MKFKDSFIIAGGLLVQQIASFVVGIYIARSIGAEDYGTLAVARNYATILLTLTPLGLDLALLKYLPSIENDRAFTERQFFTFRAVVFVCNCLVVGAALAAGPYLERHLYQFENFTLYFGITVASLPFAADIALFGAYYRVFNKTGTFSLLTSYLQTILRSIACLAALWLGFSTFGVTIATTGSAIVAVGMILVHHRFMRKPALAPVRDTTTTMRLQEVAATLKESVWMAMNLFVYGLTRSVDVIVLGIYVSSQDVGSYGALGLVAYVVAIYPIALSQTLGPTVARLFNEKNLPGIRDALNNYIRLASIISSFIFAGIAGFGERLDLLLGNSFHISPWLALLLPLGHLVSATLAPTGYALSMTGKHKTELTVLIAGGVLLVALLFMLVPIWGDIGAASAIVTTFVLLNVIRYEIVARHIGSRPGSARDLIPPLAGIVFAYSARYASDTLLGSSFADVVSGCLAYTVLYTAFIWTTLLRMGEKDSISRIIFRKFA